MSTYGDSNRTFVERKASGREWTASQYQAMAEATARRLRVTERHRHYASRRRRARFARDIILALSVSAVAFGMLQLVFWRVTPY